MATLPQDPGPTLDLAPVPTTSTMRLDVPTALRSVRARGGAWLTSHRRELAILIPVLLYLVVALQLLTHAPVVSLACALSIAAALAASAPNISADLMARLYRAQDVAPGQGTALRAAVHELSARAGLERPPRLAIIPTASISAFSAGQLPKATVFLTEGLVRLFTLQQIVAIAAHEIAHIKGQDLTFFATADAATRLAQVMFYIGCGLICIDVALIMSEGSAAVGWAAILTLLLAPTLNSQLQLRLSRERDYEADRFACQLLGESESLAVVALATSHDYGSPLDDLRLPVPQRRSALPSPARSHLVGSDRHFRLQSYGEEALAAPSMDRLRVADAPFISLAGLGPVEMRPRNHWPGLWF